MIAREKLPSVRALWAILWRSVVFFPVGIFLMTAPVIFPFSGILLVAWAYAFSLEERWLEVAGCIAVLPVVFILGRAWARWNFATGAGEDQLDGESRV